MGTIITTQTTVLVQGITGNEGARATEEMIASGISVVAGVTPGKGGKTIHNVPVYDSVQEAIAQHEVNTSVIYVPPLMVYDAAMEAMYNGITTLLIITENVPVRDTALLCAYAQQHGICIVGPSSIGVLDTRLGKLGSIAKPGEQGIYTKGSIGIISKSGGMCAETALVLSQAGYGQSSVVGIGGDQIMGISYADLLPLFEQDADTEAIVIYGEIGGGYEEELAEYVAKHTPKKPILAYISGQFAETLPRSMALGHAGAIIEDGKGKAVDKKAALQKAGVIVVDFHYEIPAALKKALKK